MNNAGRVKFYPQVVNINRSTWLARTQPKLLISCLKIHGNPHIFEGLIDQEVKSRSRGIFVFYGELTETKFPVVRCLYQLRS